MFPGQGVAALTKKAGQAGVTAEQAWDRIGTPGEMRGPRSRLRNCAGLGNLALRYEFQGTRPWFR